MAYQRRLRPSKHERENVRADRKAEKVERAAQRRADRAARIAAGFRGAPIDLVGPAGRALIETLPDDYQGLARTRRGHHRETADEVSH